MVCVYKTRNSYGIAQWFRHIRWVFLNDVTIEFYPISAVVEYILVNWDCSRIEDDPFK